MKTVPQACQVLSDSALGAAAAWSHSSFSWASQDQCYIPSRGWSESGFVLDLKEQVCSYFETWRIEAPSGNTSVRIHTVVGCGLYGDGLLLFRHSRQMSLVGPGTGCVGLIGNFRILIVPSFLVRTQSFQFPSSQALLVPVTRNALSRWRCLLFSVYFCQPLTRFA